MADSKLTDLPEITTLSNDDVLYVADISLNASNKITYGNLINDKFNALNNSYTLTAVQITTNTNNIATLRSDVDTLINSSTGVSVDLDAFAIADGSRFTSSFDVSENLGISNGDVLISSLDIVGGLSGLQIQVAPVSSSHVRFDAINTTGGSLTVTPSAVLFIKKFSDDIT